MKKFMVLLMLVVFLNTTTSASIDVEVPPIPAESPQTEKVAIVTLPKSKTEAEIKELIKSIPGLELRYVFQHALTGFSVKGSITSLHKLAETNHLLTVSPVNTYEATSEENIEIIGGEEVRGMFDRSDKRLTGEGVTVGVIDTGIDYTHPDLRRNYYGGHDLVDQDKDPMETNSQGSQDTLHGTHVAGIIAANGKINGVAPGAKVIAYRALGPGGSGTTEQVIAAIEQAIKDKVDILNLSLGNNVNGPDLPISLALNKAVEKGITAVTSSGNSGPNMWTVGSPGTATKAISVGASTPPMKIPVLKASGISEEIRLEPMHGASLWKLDRSYPIAFAGLGKKEQMKNINGKIALIERGEITFTEKAKNAAQAGAVAVIIYNNTKGSFIGNIEEAVSIPVSTVAKEAGEKLKRAAQKNDSIIKTYIIEEKDILADFSSRGPVTSTWEIKPDVVAPGVAINSTVPGGYLALQGTSMAAPHVAGACALIKQAHPGWGPVQIKAALMNTAVSITNQHNTPYRTYEQGAGRIQIEEAVKTKSLVIPGSLQFGKFSFNDNLHEHKQYITVENVSTTEIRYSFDIPADQKGIKWEMPFSFTLKPKEKKKVEIIMSVEPRLIKKKIQDGYLTVHAGSQKISIPYLYVLEEPNYPRIMGFDFGAGDNPGEFRYEVYLPGGAEEFGIALFDPDNYQFVGFLDWKRNVGKGMLKVKVSNGKLPENGMYLAKVFAKMKGKEDMIDTVIFIQK